MANPTRACGRCDHALYYTPAGQLVAQLQCRHSPPAVIVFPGQFNPKSGEMSMTVISVPPPIPPDHWCKQFVALPEGQEVARESANAQTRKDAQ